MFNINDYKLITSREELKNVFPFPPAKIYMDSVLGSLERYSRLFIESASLVIISSAGEDGIKTSPRGGEPGFIHILDDNWLLLPDAKGNNKVETFQNLLADNRAGLLFIVNGYDVSLRLTARAHITNDKALLSRYPLNNKVAKIGTLFHIERVYLHCGKAINHARLWNSNSYDIKKRFPSVGTMLKSMIRDLELSVSEIDDYVERNK